MFVAMYSSVQGLCGLPLTQHCYVKPWAPCSSAQLCRHPLQACSKHSPLSSQRAPALLSSAKQLRAPGSSTVVTRVKHTLLLTHKTHARGLGTTHVRGHTEIGGVLFRDRGKKKVIVTPTQLYWRTFSLKHNTLAYTPAGKHAGQGQGTQTQCAAS